MIQYRIVSKEEINRELFQNFVRHQNVTDCWRRDNNTWVIKSAPFVDDWSEEDYHTLVTCLKNTAATGGLVYAAFYDGKLKGFASVESGLFGGAQNYLDLTSIHVSEDMRGEGIGKALFCAAKAWAKEHGAKKLNISRCIIRCMSRRSRTTASWNVNCHNRLRTMDCLTTVFCG